MQRLEVKKKKKENWSENISDLDGVVYYNFQKKKKTH